MRLFVCGAGLNTCNAGAQRVTAWKPPHKRITTRFYAWMKLAQVDAREAGEVAYMLANGTGKQRAQRDGLAKPKASWRLLFLSAGEIGLAQHMREAGKKARAGQEVRLADIPADAGAGYGLFETLHGYPGRRALV